MRRSSMVVGTLLGLGFLVLAGGARLAPVRRQPGPEEAARVYRPVAGGPPTVIVDDGPGGVWAEVTWVTAGFTVHGVPAGIYDLEQELAFLVSLTTHSGDLSRYDVLGKARLYLEDGAALAPAKWLPTNQDSHHPSGLLLFQGDGLLGEARGADRVDLVLQDLGRVPARVYRWTGMPGQNP